MAKKKKFNIGMFILIAFFVYFVYIAIGQQKIIDNKNLENIKLQNKISEEEKTNKALKKQKEMLNSDESNEKNAREKLGMVKSGERVYVDIGN